jgi:hypothetical protein
VNDEFGAADELEKARRNLRKLRFRCEPLATEAMDLLRTGVDVTLGIQVTMEGAPGWPPEQHLDAADFYDPVILVDFEAGGLGVQHDLSHVP